MAILQFVAYFAISAVIIGFGMWTMGDLTPLDLGAFARVTIASLACACLMSLKDWSGDRLSAWIARRQAKRQK
jgi:cytochrome c biogenesis protein CcdA